MSVDRPKESSAWLFVTSLVLAAGVAELFWVNVGRSPDGGLIFALLIAAVVGWLVARPWSGGGTRPIAGTVILVVMWLLWLFMAAFTGIMSGVG